MTAVRGAPAPKATRASRKLVETVIGAVIPFVAAVATIRYLVPSRMDGGAAGFFAFTARFGDEHPLALGVLLFVLFSETSQYWWRRYGHDSERSFLAISATSHGRRFWASLAAVVLLALFARTSLVEIARVVGASMAPTLNVRDRALVNRVAYGLKLPFSRHVLRPRPPRRGDVIVFPKEAVGDVQPDEPRILVKRVLGLPGDVVAFDHGAASINGWPLPVCDAGPFASTAGTATVRGRLVVELLEDRAYLTVRTPADETTFAAFRVLPGEVFVAGDDRALSRDSRAWNHGRGGGVPIDQITGRVSRLAVGALRDGRLDLGHVLSPLGLAIREPDVDLRRTAENIAACLGSVPRAAAPPPAPSVRVP